MSQNRPQNNILGFIDYQLLWLPVTLQLFIQIKHSVFGRKGSQEVIPHKSS
ncbi:hypothetical protein HMPREF1870_00764 [Bacteroidales bacterium KA00344]|nr:hypothetical protein HMPREF1870_00764 [Bacteroidales bacterium KA00344]